MNYLQKKKKKEKEKEKKKKEKEKEKKKEKTAHRASTMAESRVLIWPCDVNGLPALPIVTRADDATVSFSGYGDRMVPERAPDSSKGALVSRSPGSYFDKAGKFAVIGWKHESPSGRSTTTITAVAVGAIFIPHAHENNPASIENIQTNEHRVEPTTVASDKPGQDIISSVIQLLSNQFPCIATKSPCGECIPCAAYNSLQILHVVSHDDPSIKRKIDRKEDANNQRYQILLYNPREASDWYTQSRHKQPHISSYPRDSWERTLLLVCISYHVLHNFQLAMVCLKHNKITTLTGSTNVEAEVFEKSNNDICDSCKCFKIQETNPKRDTCTATTNSFSIWNESLLLLHWNGACLRHFSQSRRCCNGLSGNMLFRSRNAESRIIGNKTIGLASVLGPKVPLFSLIRMFSLQEAGRNNKTKFKSVLLLNEKSNLCSHAASTAIFLDASLGLLIGIAFMTCHRSIIHAITYSWEQYHDSFWDKGLAWLQSNPAGVKMNVALTKQIGTGVRWLLHYHAGFISHLFITNTSAPALIQIVGALTIVFGSRFFFALAFDSSRLAILHIYILTCLFSACQRLELSTLSSLWLLFRGKKRNILRLRSDHLDYDHMQLLLGMLLFSVCLFLFTTVLVHHWFFVVVGGISELMLSGMWIGYMGVESIFYIEKILRDSQSTHHMGSDYWVGMHVKLHKLSLSEHDACWRRLDNAYVAAFFNGSIPNNTNVEGIKVAALSPYVSVKSLSAAVSKLSFPMTSNASTVSKAFLSFLTLRLARITTFLSSLILAIPCSVTSSCIDITRSLQQSYNSWAAEQ
ncbi:hypothetical protein HJC23_007899 [Cyclotella cryptica]|uniref:Uncharacterized protein n=1 Tax=Cyclotella cryptica TaxID=29204 RepID=A0ABD3R0H8_9STRA